MYLQNYEGCIILELFQDFCVELVVNRIFEENYMESFKIFDKENGGGYVYLLLMVGG